MHYDAPSVIGIEGKLRSPREQDHSSPRKAAKRCTRAMSLPKELLDQLLSGYLDDALTVDERVRVEQLLQSNAEVAAELEQLRDLRRSLQVLSRADSDIRLDRGFADRVLGAAVARAREEGLADDHPLIRLAEQPSTSPSVSAPGNHSWRNAAILVGLAASIALAVFLLRPQSEIDPSMIAKVDPVQNNPQDGQVAPESVEPSPGVEPGPMLVENSQPAAEEVATIAPLTPADPLNPTPVVDEPRLGSAPREAVAAVEVPAPAMTPDSGSAVRKSADPMMQLGAILVVDVRRTDAGRVSDAVAKAMEAADITPSSRKEVTEQITGFVAGNVDKVSEDTSVLYLQLPGRKFDRFHQQLWADQEGIESVRMTIAVDAPFLEVVDSVRPDPTTVQHEGATFELFSQGDVVDQLAHELSELPFPVVDRSKPAAAAAALGTGPDIQAQVLVLVH